MNQILFFTSPFLSPLSSIELLLRCECRINTHKFVRHAFKANYAQDESRRLRRRHEMIKGRYHYRNEYLFGREYAHESFSSMRYMNYVSSLDQMAFHDETEIVCGRQRMNNALRDLLLKHTFLLKTQCVCITAA